MKNVRSFCWGLLFLATSAIATFGQSNTIVRFHVGAGSKLVGNIDVELFDQDKPNTVSNFLAYVDSGRFKNTFFYDLQPGFKIKGGEGSIINPYSFAPFQIVNYLPEFAPVDNEYNSGPTHSNLVGTLAMEKNSDGKSTSTFFFNLGDNSYNRTNASQNLDSLNGGYTVFGRIVAGSNAITTLNALSKFDSRGYSHGIIDVTDFLNYGFYCSFTYFYSNSVYSGWAGGTNLPVAFLGNYCVRYVDLLNVTVFRLTNSTTDTAIPTVAITSPAQNATVTNDSVTVTGTASDAGGLKSVDVILNHERLQTATGTTSWSAAVTNIYPGSNTLTVVSTDLAGNQSKTQFRPFFYKVSLPVHLAVQGQGTISGLTNGQILDIGRIYTLTAKPDPGYLFDKWSGVKTSFLATTFFVMDTNYSLTAEFVPNPFLTTKGTYNGIFRETNDVTLERAGSFTLALTDRGTYSGKLTIMGKVVPFTGEFDVNGSTSRLIDRSGTNYLFISMDLDLTNGTKQITGRVSSVSGATWSTRLVADPVSFNPATQPAPQAGLYTMIFPGTPGSTTEPVGDSYATIKVDTAGKVTYAGALADGTKVTVKSTLASDGRWPFYSSLYAGKGVAIGWLQFVTNDVSTDIAGEVAWLKSSAAGWKYYPAGFIRTNDAVGSVFTKPADATDRILNVPTGTIAFTGGNLPSDFSNTITIAPNSTVTTSSPNKLTTTFSKGNGLMSGTVVHPSGTPTSKYNGVVLQKQAIASGFFLGTNQVGRAYLSGP